MESIVAGISGVIVAVAACMTAIIWISKRLVTSSVSQTKTLIDAGLTNMRANTEAIQANTTATNELAKSIEKQGIIRDERDKSFSKQLDRIESAVQHRK